MAGRGEAWRSVYHPLSVRLTTTSNSEEMPDIGAGPRVQNHPIIPVFQPLVCPKVATQGFFRHNYRIGRDVAPSGRDETHSRRRGRDPTANTNQYEEVRLVQIHR